MIRVARHELTARTAILRRSTPSLCRSLCAGPTLRPSGVASASSAAPASEFSIRGSTREGRAIYLDSQATTPLDPRALDAMLPYMTGMYGNPHSVTHQYGWESAEVVDTARDQISSLINANPKEIVFTSGATESNNMAIKGVANFYAPRKLSLIHI